ncbi:DinB family protein [Pedobacter zeae]|uniref:Protein DinB n=1 Tax=Pedobacter zeae TaxID=1737356 RepID=A0A7W6P8D9_9SPHI|nr:DinB family protein [Pedobacter zeae]MBB4109986.1 putative damage-inducible protein DinB [Pedobacter zeae]GGH15347.1 protein DinB [Pedobacter zeae]
MIQEQLTAETMEETSLVYLMKNYANYNFWANLTLVNWLKPHPEALLEQEVLSSFKSVKLTLAHILQAQEYWYSILTKTEFKFREYGSLNDIFDSLLKQSENLATYITAIGENKFNEKTEIQSPWFTSDFENFEYVLHVFNHSTYHRGQIITICHNLGITGAPMTDYNFYNVVAK